MFVSMRQMRLAGVRRGARSILSSSRGPLRDKSANFKSYNYGAASGFASTLENRNRLRFNTFCVEPSRCWNVSIVQSFSTVPRPPNKRSNRNLVCSEDGCSTTASYGWEGGRREFCAKHKKEEMVNLSFRPCQHPDKCKKRPSFGFPGDRPTLCGTHKLERMEDVRHQRCQEPGCAKRPNFDVPGGKGLYCTSHKKPGMLDVKSPRCQEPECQSLMPIFDVPGGKGRYCGRHKKSGMVDVRNRRCEEPGCELHPSYGDPEGKVRRFCAMHKLKHMVHHTHRPKRKETRKESASLSDVST